VASKQTSYHAVEAMQHTERHRTHRTGWLRAAVLGANDGIVSTASLVLGVAAAGADTKGILVAGVAGLVAGAMSMAAGEYVSVSSQADTERADLARESTELATLREPIEPFNHPALVRPHIGGSPAPDPSETRSGLSRTLWPGAAPGSCPLRCCLRSPFLRA
jgi:hypothetical protein